MARIVARNPKRSERSEHSGTHVLPSVQLVRPGRYRGLLVMRRSGVRFPKAAPKAAPLETRRYQAFQPGAWSSSSFDLQLKRPKCPRNVPAQPGSLPQVGIDHVAIQVHRHRRSRVPEHSLNHLQVRASGEPYTDAAV